MFSYEQCVEFEQTANPHAWFLVASGLHDQTVILRLASNNKPSYLSRKDADGNVLESWNISHTTIILLCGFALENMLKAFLILEHPDYIAKGRLSNKIRHHKLTKLANSSNLVPYKFQSLKTLGFFEDGLKSWTRYPCGLDYSQTRPKSVLSDHMWNNYRWLMKAYEKRFNKLISKWWDGPYEMSGKFVIKEGWFD